jgi:hypothetical protein
VEVSLAAGDRSSEKGRSRTGGALMELATRPDGDDRHAADRSLGGWGSAALQGSGEPRAEGSMHHACPA